MSEHQPEGEQGGVKWLRDQISCQSICATRTDVPGYLRLIAEGRFEQSYALIRETNPFPSICGRVCHHPCETHCRRAQIDAPVAIDALKRFVSDYVIRKDRKIPVIQDKPNGKRVAIVGAGPAGLTAAHDLARFGYAVEVYDREHIPGGMLAVGIPEYRLPKETLNFEIGHIRDHGVKIHCGVTVGPDVAFADLREKHDAILLALGAHKAGGLGLPEEDKLEGVVDCLDFLRRTNRGEAMELGKAVAVIGGGNTAVDCARMALRLGSRVTLVYRRTRNEMPALPWEVSEAEREGVRMLYLASPVHMMGWQGRLKGLICTRMTLGEPDASGRRRPIPVEGSDFLVEVDSLIPTISLSPDLSPLLNAGVELGITERGTLVVEAATCQTSMDAVFAAGDVVTGPRTVIDAIAAGHDAALSIHCYLQDLSEPPAPARTLEITEVSKLKMFDNYDGIHRHPMPALPLRRRMGVFDEVELGFTEEMAIKEAQRCLQCDHTILIQDKNCITCGRCSDVCPYGCIRMVTRQGEEAETLAPWFEGTVKMRDEALCIRCGLCIDICPVGSVTYRKVAEK